MHWHSRDHVVISTLVALSSLGVFLEEKNPGLSGFIATRNLDTIVTANYPGQRMQRTKEQACLIFEGHKFGMQRPVLHSARRAD